MKLRRIALVGQPNAGKSTLFNALVGYRAVASNFPGTTVEALRGRALIAGRSVEVVDLPGVYSLLAGDRAEQVTRDFLTSGQVDAVVDVVDASLLGRSLDLTLELAELGLPLVVCLNMVDEAEHKGVRVDAERLSALLGVPVVATVAVRGVGLKGLLAAIPAARAARPPAYAADVEAALSALTESAAPLADAAGLPPRYVAMRLLAGDPPPDAVGRLGMADEVRRAQEELSRGRGEDPAVVLSGERHVLALRLFGQVAQVAHARVGWRERLDDVLMHPVGAYPLLALVLFGLFWVVFQVGGVLEGLLLPPLEGLSAALGQALGGGVAAQVVVGAFQGLWAGVAIVLPYLVPFLFFLAFLEDVGYLPRVGFLMDGLMHRIGLHGKSVIPFLLGYGCSVPAVLATRILEDERDRLVTAALAVMVPCAGRAIVVFGLVARFVGPAVAFGLYVMNAVVIALAGWAVKKFLPGLGPGLILEIPPYRRPSLSTTAAKVWLRLREFTVVAWPLLVVSSALLALAQAVGWTQALNVAARPLTWPLGLPAETGVPLALGILRKELSLVMLTRALGTARLSAVLSPGQMVVFTGFVLFYMPCLATLAALGRELGARRTALVLLGTTGVALTVAVVLRGLVALF
ncbi:MAG: ferrous iron transport protein B [Candidatus Bipolaricaulaceae bacterium]